VILLPDKQNVFTLLVGRAVIATSILINVSTIFHVVERKGLARFFWIISLQANTNVVAF
jgi:hypothetical protein